MIKTMADKHTDNALDVNIDKLWTYTCKDLKDILRNLGQPVSGNKDILVARVYSASLTGKVNESQPVECGSETQHKECDALSVLRTSQTNEITYNDIMLTTSGRVWSNDLRDLPNFTFDKLFTYLVERTNKYGASEMKGVSYKKMKSYQFFVEGHVTSYEIAKSNGLSWVRCKVIASMKQEKYKVIVVFEDDDVKFAACECPAGLGINGNGKCNHVGGLLFAIEDFTAKGKQDGPVKMSSTSRLNEWIVPRNLPIQAKSLSEMKIRKFKYGKSSKEKPTVNDFDPRAPQDRVLDTFALQQLHRKLQDCASSSGFFLYHDDPESMSIPEADYYDTIDGECLGLDVSINSTFTDFEETIKESENPGLSLTQPKCKISVNPQISDQEQIDDKFIRSYVEEVIENEKISDEEIQDVEKRTIDQANSDEWMEWHKHKITASNFGKVFKCRVPESAIKQLLYTNASSYTLQYGKDNEQNAVKAYMNMKAKNGTPVKVEDAGLVLSKDRPGLGASLDGRVTDESVDDSCGGLECKCPISQKGKTAIVACSDKNFYLQDVNGQIALKRNHNYYIQIQGQMFCTGLKWVDFVVWFGDDQDIFCERIYFNEKQWYSEYLPVLDLFYKWVFVPELLTRRLERGLSLITPEQWKNLKYSDEEVESD
ncbi:uncharacterized protein LOC123555858 [Mercenaria mercenaria]|uniref:uncharacterized protein LOC123555858 n=1 Tax=Mercenaria mercenaria TaxID=6596 RepID=UPI00234F26C6|nr:uncharacterized protein LOC123555858 [Mercenaria mercenaria]